MSSDVGFSGWGAGAIGGCFRQLERLPGIVAAQNRRQARVRDSRVDAADAKNPDIAFRHYLFGDGRTLQVVKEQDEGHAPAELQTGQNRTAQAHPHFPLHTFPLYVWPVATVATVGRSQGMIICASALSPRQTNPDNATAIWSENRDRLLDMAPPVASYHSA